VASPDRPRISENVCLEEVSLTSGPGTLLVQKAHWRNTRDQVTLVWSVPDRVYL
jgi:hypothetical protein